jgi:ketosteroid isomerase-like protein
VTAPTRSDAERELREGIAAWSRAAQTRDLDALVADYTPQSVFFDATPPYRERGAESLQDIPAGSRSEHADLQFEIEGDLAIVHGLHRFVPPPPAASAAAHWLRATVCLRRLSGRWKVLHEHVSAPFQPLTGRTSFLREALGAVRMPRDSRGIPLGRAAAHAAPGVPGCERGHRVIAARFRRQRGDAPARSARPADPRPTHHPRLLGAAGR